MLSLPSAAESFFLSLSGAFTQPTFQSRLVGIPLVVGAILTTGRRTVTDVLWTMRGFIWPSTSATEDRRPHRQVLSHGRSFPPRGVAAAKDYLEGRQDGKPIRPPSVVFR